MKRVIGGFPRRGISIAVIAVSSLFACGEGVDPVASTLGTPFQITTNADTVVAVVDDSVEVLAHTLDSLDNLLPHPPAIAILDGGIASVSLDEARSRVGSLNFYFWVKGLALGTTRVTLESGGVSRVVVVTTVPAYVQVAGAPAQLPALDSVLLYATARGRTGTLLLGAPIRWGAGYGGEVDSLTGWVIGLYPNRTFEVTATTIGGASGSTYLRIVQPDTFPGTISPQSGRPGTVVTIKAVRPIGPRIYEEFFYQMPAPPLVLLEDADSAVFVAPVRAATGLIEIKVQPAGWNSPVPAHFRYTSIEPLDSWEPNNDPLTAPVITNGSHVIYLGGDCVGGISPDPSADCDDYFTVVNPTADSIEVHAVARWMGVRWGRDAIDVNILWTDEMYTQTVGNFDGATATNNFSDYYDSSRYEESLVKVPPHTTWRLWLNLYDSRPTNENAGMILLEIDGLP